MKKYLLLAALVLAGCASPVTRAPWRAIPGAGVEGKCNVFAKESQAELLCRGVAAYYVVYSWTARGNAGRHAVTIFREEEKYFLVDNIMVFPVRVYGNSILKLVKSYDSDAVLIWDTSGLEELLPVEN